MPLANSYLTSEELDQPEPRHPLAARVCGRCFLVQVEPVVRREDIFEDYAYFSSMSESWVSHARRFARRCCRTYGLDADSRVLEVASNDGYLLQHFVAAGVPVLGIEPAANVAAAARAIGCPTEVAFFGSDTARRLGVDADLVVANNVLAHVPDLNDFIDGLRISLKPSGVLSIEVPHLLRLIEGVQFDTIYHEHFSYFSLLAAQRAFAALGVTVFDVETLPTHGGSIRIWASRSGSGRRVSPSVERMLHDERSAGLDRLVTYERFSGRVDARRRQVLDFLCEVQRAGISVAGYGAAAKGTTLINSCGITTELLPFVSDRSPHKQGRYLPGSRIPVVGPHALDETRPSNILLLAWNLADEVTRQLAHVRSWGARFVTTMPSVHVLP